MLNKRILLIEDDFMNMRLAQHVLEAEGYTVTKAATGQEALKQIESSLPDLVLMDLQLPDIDGMTLVRILRANDMTRNATILALTAFAMKGDREKILKIGCNDYISKPINIQQFINIVRRYLGPGNQTKRSEKGAHH
jgi:two-component system cell cycle response regulator DivK